MLVQSAFFWYSRIPEILSTPLSSIDFKFLFWSFWSHLSSSESWIYSVSRYLLFYIIFLVCHLSISLPRVQDDYIIELNFNSFWISLLGASGSHLMSSSLGASHHSGHHVPLFLASFSSASSAHHLITSHNISDLSLLDRYRDSLNPDSWESSLILGMILWLIIRSYHIRYLDVLSGSLRIKLRARDNP